MCNLNIRGTYQMVSESSGGCIDERRIAHPDQGQVVQSLASADVG